MNKILIDFDGKPTEVFAEKVHGVLWVHLNGKTFSWSPEKRRKSQIEGALNEKELHSPMPGKITKTLAQAGDDVKKGQVVIVMEAMKMEYSLKAVVDGKIKKVSCKEGDQVSLNQVLVEFES